MQYPQEEGPGLFTTLTNPYAFVTAQVRHVLRAQAWRGVTPEDVEDAVQDALLWAWERRHCRHITDFPAYISTGSCTSTLRIIRSARESGKLSPFHYRARGLCHDSTAIFRVCPTFYTPGSSAM